MKPPRSVWVRFDYGYPAEVRLDIRGITGCGYVERYDLHRPKKRKARNAKSASARRGDRMGR